MQTSFFEKNFERKLLIFSKVQLWAFNLFYYFVKILRTDWVLPASVCFGRDRSGQVTQWLVGTVAESRQKLVHLRRRYVAKVRRLW